MRERHVCELVRRIREHADPDSGRLQAAKLCARLGVRPKIDRRAVVAEALEQRTPVAKLLVENSSRRGSILGHVELDVRPPRDVLEPVAPQRSSVSEHGIEIKCYRLQVARC